MKFQTLHWTSNPRIVWLANSRAAEADKDGHFRLAGLERGELFSLVTSQADGGDGKHDFELSVS